MKRMQNTANDVVSLYTTSALILRVQLDTTMTKMFIYRLKRFIALFAENQRITPTKES